MKKILAPLVATALIITGGLAHAEDAQKPATEKTAPDKPHRDRFKEADANSDGFLTKDEMLAGHKKRLDEMFAKTDANKDGKLSKDEMEKGRDEMRKHFKDRKKGGPGGCDHEGPPPEPKE